ncbi:MAG: hypothetical protein ABI113_08140 [Mucilaginibacter sp.]
MITDIEQQTLDIEWFFTSGNQIGFAASAGGQLPDCISKKSLDELKILSDYFWNASPNGEAILNNHLTKNDRGPGDQFVSDFIEMSSRGLFSFDKTVPGNFADTGYKLISRPANPLILKSLPDNISLLLKDAFIRDEMPETFDISDFGE